MQALHLVGVVYFVLLFALVNWKGRAFFEMPFPRRTVTALIAVGLWAAWIVVLHYTS